MYNVKKLYWIVNEILFGGLSQSQPARFVLVVSLNFPIRGKYFSWRMAGSCERFKSENSPDIILTGSLHHLPPLDVDKFYR